MGVECSPPSATNGRLEAWTRGLQQWPADASRRCRWTRELGYIYEAVDEYRILHIGTLVGDWAEEQRDCFVRCGTLPIRRRE